MRKETPSKDYTSSEAVNKLFHFIERFRGTGFYRWTHTHQTAALVILLTLGFSLMVLAIGIVVVLARK